MPTTFVFGAFSESMSASATVSTSSIEAVWAAPSAAPRPDATAAAVPALFPLPDTQEGNIVGVALAAVIVAPSSSGPQQRHGIVSQVQPVIVAKSRFAAMRDSGRSKLPLAEMC